MSDSAALPASGPPRPTVVVTLRELQLLTFSVWIGGICIMTLMPFILIPRLGMPWGVAASYGLFFVVWQPIQAITQRTLGAGRSLVRMLFFVVAGATISYYLREALLSMAR
jgi:hypothetical protein